MSGSRCGTTEIAGDDRSGAVFYLARDGDRALAVAAELNGRLFCYVPNVQAFIYNKPLTVDFLIDRNKQYDRITADEAAQIAAEGYVGRINDDDITTLTEWATTEPQRLDPEEVLVPRGGRKRR